MTDFQGGAAPGSDTIELANSADPLVFRGEVNINPVNGAALPGGGDGVTEVVYTTRGGSTWLLADGNDNGRLDGTDFAVRFTGTHDFNEDDFEQTDFVTAGTQGDDTLVGTDEDDVIFGLAGNDLIQGLGGSDELDGGAGNDTLESGAGQAFDFLRGGDGDDILRVQGDFGGVAEGGAGNDLIVGSPEQFAFVDMDGGTGNDTMIAGAGDTTFVGGEGDDRMEGGAGDDQFIGNPFGVEEGTDMFVFGAVWTDPLEGFTDIVWDMEDGLEKLDLTGSGLQFADLTLEDLGFMTVVTSTAGRIEVMNFGSDTTQLTADDFLFA
jgi:Ca2+-binding RTX toxin-like protein